MAGIRITQGHNQVVSLLAPPDIDRVLVWDQEGSEGEKASHMTPSWVTASEVGYIALV